MSKEITSQWHQDQVRAFVGERPIYEAYRVFLRDVLQEICRRHAPMAMVQSRAKAVPSFAEKAVRKWPGVQDPVNDLDDLCGARVVALNQEEVEKVGRVIEAEFLVNQARSGDKRLELASTQFGYLAKHFVVQLPDVKSMYGVELPAGVGQRRAEIQVKTLLQHAWASVSHDTLYKNDFAPPEAWHRRMARLAALLEEADQGFADFMKDQETMAGSYAVYMTPDKIKRELGILEMMLGSVQGKERAGLALRYAGLLKAREEWERVVSVLSDHRDDPMALREMAHAQVRLGQAQGSKEEIKAGVENFLALLGRNGEDHQAHFYLAQAHDFLGDQTAAKTHYGEAYERNPDNPYYLMAYLEKDLKGKARPNLQLFGSAMGRALQASREHAALGIEIPGSLFTAGKLALLQGDLPAGCLSFLEALLRCPGAAGKQLATQRASLADLRANLSAPAAKILERLLALASAVLEGEPLPASLPSGSGVFRGVDEVLIVAGSCDQSFDEQVARYQAQLREALLDFSGVVVCGGTVSGIAGLVGRTARELARDGQKKFRLVGYLPPGDTLPDDARRSGDYDELLESDGKGFSLLESLQTWLDIASAGLGPDRVRVLGFGGGEMTGLEYRLALALGSQVGVVADSGRAVDAVLAAPHWRDAPTLLPLPTDAMTFKAFATFLPQKGIFGREQLEKAARSVHENYSRQQTTVPYEDLEERLKDSNLEQVRWSLRILEAAGFEARPAPEEGAELVVFSQEDMGRLAPMEHGRWNLEKLAKGYRYGQEKDESKKLHDCLAPWEALSPKIKGLDIHAVQAWPEIFARAGWEIRRKGQGPDGK